MNFESKNIYFRYRLIDRVLRDYKTVKTSVIIDKLHERHDISVGETTIQRDIRNMVTDLHAPIEYDNSAKAYYYPDNVDEIFPAIDLQEEEINALLFYVKTINQYKDYPIFERISDAVKKVIDNSNISKKTKDLFNQKTLLETEKHPPISGIELIADLLDAISNKKIIEIEYQRFGATPKVHRLKPILLKEDKLMWYIMGINTESDRLFTFALDRINNVIVTEEGFSEIIFDSDEYFKHSFGITVLGEHPLEVIISFDAGQGDYLKTLPIHSSQEILSDTKDEFVIKLIVKPSYEFYSKIYSYGDTATILSPEDMKEDFFNTFKNAVNNYKSAK